MWSTTFRSLVRHVRKRALRVFPSWMGPRNARHRPRGRRRKNLGVCIVTSRLVPEYGGGARQALGLCRELKSLGAYAFLVTVHQGTSTTVDRVAGCAVIRLPRPSGGTFALARFYLRLLALLLAKRHRYGVIHSQAIHHHTYVACFAGRLLRKPAVAKISLPGHDDPRSISKRRFGRLQRRFLRSASLLITARQDAPRAAASWGWPPDRMVSIPNGVDLGVFRPPSPADRSLQRHSLAIDDRRFVAVYVGVIAYRKGIDTLIDSWPAVVTNHSSALLLLAGPGTVDEHWAIDACYVASVRERVSRNGLDEHVRFLGTLEDPRLPLHASDLFVLASRSEGMPNALLEAMACGLPFVATGLDAVKEMAPAQQQPYLVPADNAAALTETIIKLASDPGLRATLGQASRCRAEQRFSLTSVAERHLRLYQDLAGHPNVQSHCPGP